MELQDIVEKATINFPTPLRLRNAKRLLRYISENLPGNVISYVEQYESWLYDKENKKSTMNKGTLKIPCSINNINKIMEFDSMVLEPWEQDTSYVGSIKFQVIDDDERMYSRVLPLWDNVRNIVEDYHHKAKCWY